MLRRLRAFLQKTEYRASGHKPGRRTAFPVRIRPPQNQAHCSTSISSRLPSRRLMDISCALSVCQPEGTLRRMLVAVWHARGGDQPVNPRLQGQLQAVSAKTQAFIIQGNKLQAVQLPNRPGLIINPFYCRPPPAIPATRPYSRRCISFFLSNALPRRTELRSV